MNVSDFAELERSQGAQVVRWQDHYWVRSHMFLYRPLIPQHEFSAGEVKPPWLARLGGTHFPVRGAREANSVMSFLMFDKAGEYGLDTLDYNRRRQVKLAAKQLVVKRIVSIDEIPAYACEIYLSFHTRTHYDFLADRVTEAGFNRWSVSVFRYPQTMVLGAYQGERLVGMSVSRRVGATVFYSTFFSTDAGLRLGCSDLVLHHVREAAARSRGVETVFASRYKNNPGLNQFYLLRGCQLVHKPALLRINPLAALVLKKLKLQAFAQLLGALNSPVPHSFPKPEESLKAGQLGTRQDLPMEGESL
jgi:hypothetical protein